MRDPRNWARPVAAAVVGTTAGAGLVVLRARRRAQRRRSRYDNALERVARDVSAASCAGRCRPDLRPAGTRRRRRYRPAPVATCYRHPDRETGVSCSSCERPICPDCMTSTSVGMRCPECARDRTKVHTARSIGGDPMATYALMAVCGVAWLAELATGRGGAQGGGLVFELGALFGPAVAAGEYWRLVTSAFLHANQLPFGLLHIGFNLYILYFLGSMLEPALGRVRFVAVYFTALLAGSFGALAAQPDGGDGRRLRGRLRSDGGCRARHARPWHRSRGSRASGP